MQPGIGENIHSMHGIKVYIICIYIYIYIYISEVSGILMYALKELDTGLSCWDACMNAFLSLPVVEMYCILLS